MGVLLYELLTGHRPYWFKSRMPAEIERAICEDEPLKPSIVVTRTERQSLTDGRSTSIAPEEIGRARGTNPKQMRSWLVGDLDSIVMMALRKEPQRRYGSVDALSEDIQKHLEGLPITARPSNLAYRGGKFVRRHQELVVGAVVFLLLLGGVDILRRRDVSKHDPERQGAVISRPLTANAPGNSVSSAAISRDGKYLAYSDTAWKMYLLQIDSGELRQLPFSDFLLEGWFPDGKHLLVNGQGQPSGLWKISIEDGTSRRLLDDEIWVAVLSPDGSQIAYRRRSSAKEIWLMGGDGEAPHRIVKFEAADFVASLAWSPDGRRLVYIRGRGEMLKPEVTIETCDPQGGQRTMVLSEPRLLGRSGVSDVYWLRDGRILYSASAPGQSLYSDYNLWAVPTDPVTGRPIGSPTRLTNGPQDATNFDASADSKRFIYKSMRSNDAVYLGNLEIGAEKFDSRRLTLDEWNNWPFDWTRDSEAILFAAFRRGRYAILRQRSDQQFPEILVSGAGSYARPVFTPAGDRLLYTASATVDRLDPSKRVISRPLNGGGSSILLVGNYSYHCGSVSSAGCVVAEIQGQQLVFSRLDPAEGKGAEIERVDVHLGGDWSEAWSVSPDGNKIAVVDPAGDRGEVRVLTLADRRIVTLALRSWKWKEIQSVAWSADGNQLFATAYTGTSFVIFLIDPRGKLQVLAEVPAGEAWLANPVPSPDGRYLAYMKRTYESNVMMLEHF